MREVVNLVITTYRGSYGGEHYYGRFQVQTKETPVIREDGSTGWILKCGYGAEKHPRNGVEVKRKIGAREAAKLNKKDAGGMIFVPSGRLCAGDETIRFNDKETLIEAAKELFLEIFDDDDILCVQEDLLEENSQAIEGPVEIVGHLNEIDEYTEKTRYLNEQGYLRHPEGEKT